MTMTHNSKRKNNKNKNAQSDQCQEREESKYTRHLRAPSPSSDMGHPRPLLLTTCCRTQVAALVMAVLMLQNNHPIVWCRPSGAAAPASPQNDELSNGQRGILRTLSPLKEPAECAVFAEYGRNYLTPVDLVVKHSETNKVCIRAQFALSIRVEEAQLMGPQAENGLAVDEQPPHRTHEHVQRPILGYVPLEHELRVEESCPDSFTKKQNSDKEPGGGGSGDGGVETDTSKKSEPPTGGDSAPTNATTSTDINESKPSGPGDGESQHTREIREAKGEDEKGVAQDDELELIVTFDCGKLSFTFKRDKSKIYVSAIRGIVKLDKKNVREFIAIRPMFLTSDLDHHFKYSDEIEVVSEVQSGKHILTAIFYDTEFEAFRDTTSRDFVKPADENSKPFLDETDDITDHSSQQEPRKQAT